MLEYRRAESRPWVAAIVQKYFRVTGRPAEAIITDVDEYFEAIVYDDDVPYAFCRSSLEKAFKERSKEHLRAIFERARGYALRAA